MARRVSVIPRAVWDAKARQKARSVPANGHSAPHRPSVERLDVITGEVSGAYCLGVDPGGKTSGVALLRLDGARLAWVESHIIGDPNEWVMGAVWGVWAVEAPNVIYPGMGLATGVLCTSFTGGRWYEHRLARNGNRAAVSPQSVRIALCGRAGASDADVARALACHVDGIPKRTNSHVRDAAAVALVGWWRVRDELQRLASTRPAPPA